ncbi:hypothetical protein C0J52_28140 [Blattella germanica]|nr:hypothetical protein C0J52_28140 [Blattella germanica]
MIVPNDSVVICSAAPIPGCECCPISASSKCDQVSGNCSNLNVIGSKCSLASPSPHYYGYDSEYSGAETEIHCSDRSFDSQSFDNTDQTPINADVPMDTSTTHNTNKGPADSSSIEEELQDKLMCNPNINTSENMSGTKRSFGNHSDEEKEEGNFLKIDDDSVATVLRESHSVEVLGSYSTQKMANSKDSNMFFKCSAPSRSAPNEGEVVNDSGAEDGGYLSSVSDRINADSCSDEVSSNHIDKNDRFLIALQETDVEEELSLEEAQTIINTLNRTNTGNKTVVFKGDGIKTGKRFSPLENNSEQNSGRADCETGDNDHDSAISSRRSSTLTTSKTPFTLSDINPSIMSPDSVNQSKLINWEDSMLYDIDSEKCENHIISLHDVTDSCQSDSSILPVIYSNCISSVKRKPSLSTCSEESCSSKVLDNNICRESLSCLSLITESLEPRTPPEGKVECRNIECRNIDVQSSRFFDEDSVLDLDKIAPYFEYCQLKNDKITAEVDCKRLSISNCEALINTNSCDTPEQNDYIEFSYCRCSTVEKQPVDDSCTNKGDANCLPLLMSHAVTPSPSKPQNNTSIDLELQQHNKSSLMINKKMDDSASANECSDYGSSSGGGGGQRMTSHHSGAQGANSGSGSKRNNFTRSLSNADVPPDEKADGSLSDTAVGHLHGLENSRRKMTGSSERSGKPSGGGSSSSGQFVGLGKKSSSTSQLSATVTRNVRVTPMDHEESSTICEDRYQYYIREQMPYFLLHSIGYW